MPILKREPDLYPESLFDLQLEKYPWWVAHVAHGQLRIVISISLLRTNFAVELDREALVSLAARVGRFGRVSRTAA